jgi:hypothetical protein
VAIKSLGGSLGILNTLYLSHGVLSTSSIVKSIFMSRQYGVYSAKYIKPVTRRPVLGQFHGQNTWLHPLVLTSTRNFPLSVNATEVTLLSVCMRPRS